MTLPTNLVQIGSNGPIVREFLVSGQTSSHNVVPLHEKTKYITTHAVRVGGGYELHTIEKPVVEDKTQIRLLRHLIGLKQASKRELLHRIDTLVDENLQLAQHCETIDTTSYNDSLLEHQRELAKLQDLQKERAQIEIELAEQREYVAEMRASTSDTVLKLSESLQRVNEKLEAEQRRSFELQNYEEKSRPLLAIKEQQLRDELAGVTEENVKKVIAQADLNRVRHGRDKSDCDGRVQRILDRSLEKVLGSYSNRFVQELYLNNQMKFEIDYCKTELETLRHEIDTVQTKIAKVPKHTFNERDPVLDPTEVNKIFHFNDYPPIEPLEPETPATTLTPSKKSRAKPRAVNITNTENIAQIVKVQDEIKFATEPITYTFNIERKLHLPI